MPSGPGSQKNFQLFFELKNVHLKGWQYNINRSMLNVQVFIWNDQLFTDGTPCH